jgi:hypothetical protein
MSDFHILPVERKGFHLPLDSIKYALLMAGVVGMFMSFVSTWKVRELADSGAGGAGLQEPPLSPGHVESVCEGHNTGLSEQGRLAGSSSPAR